MDDQNYISNISDFNDLDEELIIKNEQMELEIEKLKQELKDYKKENTTFKHRIQDLEIENDHQKETLKNQMGLIKFYKQYRSDHEDSSNEKKIDELKEKINSLEGSMFIKDKKIADLTIELQEQSKLNEKLVDVITNKEEIIRKMEKGQSVEDESTNEKSDATKLEEEIDNLKEKISDLKSEKDKIIDKYEDKIKALDTENNKYQDKIYDYETEIMNLKEKNKQYEIDEAKNKGGADSEKEVEKLYKEEIENLKNALNEAKESKKQIKEKAQEQRDSDVKEIQDLEKIVEDLKNEVSELKRTKQIIENERNNLKDRTDKLIKRNKELESVYGGQNDQESILNNYKAKLDKKNYEIENLTAKCKEFKENLDQYEKDKEDKAKEFKHEKDVLQSEVDDKTKKLEVALRELNEMRAKEGKGEVNLDQVAEDPKQKLYDEIKDLKKQIEDKIKANTTLKNKIDNFEIDKNNELEAQTGYLNAMIEGYKKTIESMKGEKSKTEDEHKDEVEKMEIEIGNFKCKIATLQFETDKKLFTYKKYVKKLQTKLESLGFKFKDKKKKENYDKAKTMV